MKSYSRCKACGRRHKRSHEVKVGTDKAYSPECTVYKKSAENKAWQPGERLNQKSFIPYISGYKGGSAKHIKPLMSSPKPNISPKYTPSKSNEPKKGLFGGLKKMFRGGDK